LSNGANFFHDVDDVLNVLLQDNVIVATSVVANLE